MRTPCICCLISISLWSGCATHDYSKPPDWAFEQSRALAASRDIVLRELWIQNYPLPKAIYEINQRLARHGTKLRVAVELKDGLLLPPSNPDPEIEEKLVYLGYTAIGLQDALREIGVQLGYVSTYAGDYIIMKQKK